MPSAVSYSQNTEDHFNLTPDLVKKVSGILYLHDTAATRGSGIE